MIKLIKNTHVYAPNDIGQKDILIMFDKIALVDDNIEFNGIKNIDFEIIDGSKSIACPGFIDQHVHIIGGGGEGGYRTRTPEIQISQIVRYGVTTVVGLLGTDGTTRNMNALLAKANALEEEGISTYIYTGSYEVPTRGITDNSRSDIILIDKVIGIGEIAISDHRSSAPSVDEIAKLTQEARVGGMLSGKAGVMHLHIGDGKEKLNYLFQIVKGTDIPIKQFVPTHINRNKELFEEGIKFAKMGGRVDITSSIYPINENDSEIKPSKAIKRLIDEGIDIENITMSSDAQGSMPIFDKYGKLISLGIGTMEPNLTELRDIVFKEKIPLSTALKFLTSNVAKVLKIENKKGNIKANLDADIVLFDKKTLDIQRVIAKGKTVVKDGQPIIKGTFE